MSYSNLAMVEKALGNPKEAQRRFKQALSIVVKKFDPNHRAASA